MKYYEVVKIGNEFCLRLRESKRPVAWSKKDDALWREYCEEQEREAPSYFED